MKRQLDITNWAQERGIFEKSDPMKQIEKTREEVEETRDAILVMEMGIPEVDDEAIKGDIKDGIGDTVVTLVILAKMHGWTLEECTEAAWNEIKDREGSMIDGMFVKTA